MTLFSTADDLAKRERETADFVSGSFLALVNKTTPVIQLAAEAIKNNSAVVFDVLGVLGDALAYMENIDIQAIIDLCEAQHEITKNDLFRGDFPHKLERVLGTNAAWALKLYDEVKLRLTHANTTLYGVSLLSLAKTQPEQAMQLALQDAGSDEVLLKCSALWVLGRLLDCAQPRIESHQAAIDCVLLAQQNQDETIANAAIQAIAYAAASEPSFSKVLVILAEQSNAAALTGLSTSAFYLVHNSNAALSDDVLQALSNTAPSVADALSSLDCILSKLLERNADDPRVMAFLKTWFSKHGSRSQGDDLVESFQQTFAAISNQPSQLEKLLTLWLIDENLNVAYTAGALIRWLTVGNVEKFSFSKPVLDTLDKPHLLLLTRRLIGHCATHETALFSLSLSLLDADNAKERTHPLVFQLLAYEFGFNYGRWALEQIKAQQPFAVNKRNTCFKPFLMRYHSI